VVLGVREGRLKYIYGPYHRTEELFDLATDPGERWNLAVRPEYQTTVLRLRQWVQEWADFQRGFLGECWDRSRAR
jgi:hypothetical protein